MFDFKALYQTYSTEDLLRIIRQPSLYQPAAVEAANQVLAQRNVTEEQQIHVTQTLQQEEIEELKPNRLDKVQNKAVSFLQYLFTPSEVFDAKKWIYWLCLALSIQAIYSLTHAFSWIGTILKCQDCGFDIVAWLLIIFWLLETIMVVLLLLKKRSGWMLAVFYAGYQVCTQIFTLLNTWHLVNSIWLPVSIRITIFILVLRLLRHHDVLFLFHASKRAWMQLIIASIIISVILMLAVMLPW